MRSRKRIKLIFLSISIIIAIVIILSLLSLGQSKQIVTDGSQDQGLRFSITEVSPSGADIEYVQKKGDIEGELVIGRFGIYLQEDYKTVLELNKLALITQIPLQRNGNGSFEIDWTEAFDKLRPGEYYLRLSVYDMTYDIMEPYHDYESYYIPFTLP